MKRIISAILVVAMTLGIVPVGEMVAFAADGPVKVEKVEISKNYKTLEDLGTLRVLIEGENLEQLKVQVMEGDQLKTIQKEPASNEFVAQYSLEASKAGSKIYIQGKSYSLQDDKIPRITSKDPSNGIIDVNGTIKLSGSNIASLTEKEIDGINYKVKASFTEGTNPIYINPGVDGDIQGTGAGTYIEKTWGTEIGNFDLVFTRNDKEGVVPVEIKHTYNKILKVQGNLDVSDDIDMFPTQGPRGSEVRLEADKLIGDVSVFLLTELTDEYKQANMATDVSYIKGATGEKQTIKFKIPNSITSLGPKYVVLTNKVDLTKGDINSQVNKYKIIKITKDTGSEVNFFTVTDGNNRMKIDSILPNESSSQGIGAVLKGENIIRVSNNLYKDGKLTSNDIDISNSEKMVVKHTDGSYDGEAVATLTKEIEIIIGNKATFRTGSEFASTFDKLEITVPDIGEIEEITKKDVYIQAKTSIVFVDGKKIDFIESDKIENGFTFHPKKFQPVINKSKVTPRVIIVKYDADGKYRVADEVIISIKGENFLKFGYGDKKVKTPVVSVDTDEKEVDGSPLDTSKWFENASNEIKILKNGIPIDGEKTRQIGDQIKVKIKAGSEIPSALVSENATVVSNLRVTNPLRVEAENVDMGPSDIAEIYFKKEIPTQKPVIRRVSPSIVNTAGKEILIVGENFSKTGLKVFLDGDEIERVNRVSDTEIKFVAPPKEKGTYVIRVQNKDGEVVFHREFIYVETITDPKVIDFNPKMGTNSTKVYLKGKSLKQPSTSVINVGDKIEVLGFIGTTVKLRKTGTNDEYIDMNEYNKDKELLSYESNSDDLIIKQNKSDKELVLSDYYHSVILQDKNNTTDYYRIYEDVKTGKIMLEGGLGSNNQVKNSYELYYDDTLEFEEGKAKGKANKVGGTSGLEFTVDTTSITIDGLTLDTKTPYIQDSTKKKITGNKVKVIDGETLEFDINLNSGSNDDIQKGIYDVQIMNPDTSTADAQGKFEYRSKPESKPIITSIDHIKEGSALGKYKRTIVGTGFQEGVAVFIGEKEIRKEDVQFISEKEIRVIIPPYGGNLELETKHGRKSVKISVLNRDGGTGSTEFIYVNPKSIPRISSIALDFGPVSGGTEVTLYEDKEFMFFQSYRGEIPAGHIDLSNEAQRNLLGGNEKATAIANGQEEEWKTQLKILPTIWFGDKQAEIIRYDTDRRNSALKRTITVKVPKGADGTVPVYLENNDFGVSNTVNFKYTKINIGKIDIKPGTGNKKGNISAEIRSGEANKSNVFIESYINMFKQDGGIEAEKPKIQLVRFGNEKDLKMSNISIDGSMSEVDKENSGRMGNYSRVAVGDLNVEYNKLKDADNKDVEKLTFKLNNSEYNEEDKKVENIKYTFEANFPEGEDEVYLPIKLLKNGDKSYEGFELVKISKGRFTINGKLSSIDKLTVQRGYSEKAIAMQDGEYIDLKTPSYYTTGTVDVTVINADGSEAKTKYTYTNPSNSPMITDIFREGVPTTSQERTDGIKVIKVDHKGGVKIHIKGADFRKPSRIDIGGKVNIQGEDIDESAYGKGIEHLPKVVDRESYEELVFIMPEVPDEYIGKQYAFIVTTPYDEKGDSLNSATTSSANGEFKVYIEFTKGETNPKITKITPNKGPSSGGTEVTIEGEDFRKKDIPAKIYGDLKVFMAGKEISPNNIKYINSKKIIITTPPHESGKVKIKVENGDGSVAQVEGNNDEYTYVSNPKITNVVDPDNKDVPINSISIEGGQTIKIQGSDFMTGAKVIFNPVLKKAKDNPTATGEKISIDGTDYILESGTPGTEVEFIDSANIKVKTPPGKVETGGVIVINPDGAGTPEYEVIYGIPEITYPQDVRAILVQDEYIRINWSEVIDKATEADGKTVQYEVYVIEDGKTREFIGSTASTGFVFKDIKPKTKYKFLVRAIGKYGSSKPLDESISNEVKTGSTAGPKDPDGGPGDKTTIDKTGTTGNVVIGKDEFIGKSEFVIDLTKGVLSGSTEVAVSMSADIVLNGYGKQVKIIGTDYTANFSPTVFINSKISSNRGNKNAGVKFRLIPVNKYFELANNSGETVVSAQYLLDGKVFVGANAENVENLNGTMKLTLDYNTQMAEMRKLKDIKLVKYDEYNRRFKTIYGTGGYGTYSGDISELGTYTITGSRR